MIIVVMGVTGAGKTTVGSLLARQLGWDFVDADEFHPESNLAKMRRGIPLNDDDRRPWLERLRAEIARQDAAGRDLVLACSALKKDYRKILLEGAPAVKFVYLKGSAKQIAERLKARRGHFAGGAILAGQFADLEEPDNAVVVDIAGAPGEIVREIREKLGI
jgi:gluconokinase